MKHPRIREAVLNAIQDANDYPENITWFDGRPSLFDESELPAVAVYLTDAQFTGGDLDGDSWAALLHIEVFLGAAATDTELDEWMERKIYPALESIPALKGLIESMAPQGYDYQRDAELNLWSSADMKFSINYER